MAEGTPLDRDLVGLAVVSPVPVRVTDAAGVLGAEETQVVDAVEALVSTGVLVERDGGFAPGPEVDDIEVGSSRRASLAGRLVDRMASATPDIRGRLHLAAGDPAAAAPLLLEAANTAEGPPDAVDLATLALEAGKAAGGLDPTTEGELHFLLGRMYRSMGRSTEAADALHLAVGMLDGVRRVDALGFAAGVADDLQHPSESETLAALAQQEASAAGEPAKVGSLLFLQARQLTRLGFPAEADAAADKGETLIELYGGPVQRYFSRDNRAWIALDRGEVRLAESLFSDLREEAGQYEGELGELGKDAYWSRSAFGIGKAADAEEVAEAVVAATEGRSVWAPAFIAWIGRAEGAIGFERPEEAMRAAEAAHELSVQHLPAWTNRTLGLKARAAALAGDLDAARTLVAEALEVTPAGADGWRLRSELQAIRIALTPQSEQWPQRQAETLTDALLQARLHGAAVELMIVRARREKDEDLALEAAALARTLGNPTQAMRAISVISGWERPEAVPVARMVRAVTVPEEWQEDWQTRPDVIAAGGVEDVEGADELLRERIDEAMMAAGLSGDQVLSPAQRQAAGLVRRRPVRRRRSMAALVGGGVAVVAVAALTAAVVSGAFSDEPTTTTAAPATTTTQAPTTTTTLPPIPADGLSGTSAYRGGDGRTGVVDATGAPVLAEAPSYYWEETPGGFFGTDLVAYGSLLYVGSTTNDVVYAIDQNDGQVVFRVETGDRVLGAPAIGLPSTGSGQVAAETVLVVGSDDGLVYAANALRAGAGNLWTAEVPGVVSTAALVGDYGVVVATDNGHVLNLDPFGNGAISWQYPPIPEAAEGEAPAEAPSIGRISAAPAYADGRVWVATEDGELHVIDAVTGAAACDPIRLLDGVVVPPIVSGGAVYVATEQSGFQVFDATACGRPPERGPQFFPSSVRIALSPAVDADRLYVVEEQRLLALSLDADPADPATVDAWELPYDAGDLISTPPVVASGVVYFGSQDGVVHAVSAETGELLWTFVGIDTRIEGAPAVVDGAVFVTDVDGRIWAIAAGEE